MMSQFLLLKSGYQVIGKNNDTLKFEFNGITYVKFKATDLIKQLAEYEDRISITAAGKANVNEWGGRRTPQILVEEIEITPLSEEDF